MPLPIFLIAAGAVSLVSSIVGVKKMSDAKTTVDVAEFRNQKAKEEFEKSNDRANEVLEQLGKKELEIIESFGKFADLWEQIQNKPEFKDLGDFTMSLPKYKANEIKKASATATAIIESLGSAAAGTAGGFAAAGAIKTIGTIIHSFSTSTIAASLTGSALGGAVLTSLGGGALAAGGGGIAAGLAGSVASAGTGVGILVFGLVMNRKGTKMVEEADEAWDKMLENEMLSRKLCNFLNELRKIAARFHQSLCAVALQYRLHLDFLEKLVKDGRLNYNEYTDEEKIKIKNSVLLVQVLYSMCDTKLVLLRKETNVVNRQVILNKIDLSKEVLEKID